MNATPIRLFFHIGAGKTGTSSIQHTLRKDRNALKDRGVWYLGLMLEHAPQRTYPWQLASGSEAFHKTDPAVASRQLHEILTATVTAARSSGAHTLIWCNESFFTRNEKTRAPLKALMSDGVDVQFVAYVRRHDAWVRSAYVQWAIKHKTNRGPILSFQEWVRRRPPRFAPPLQSLVTEFPGRLSLRNLDAVKDAVRDFMVLLDIDEPTMPALRHNVTPSNVEILLRALFNTRVKDSILPKRFDRLVAPHADFSQTGDDYLRGLMPTDEALRQVRVECADDREAINKLLQASAQEPIATDELTPSSTDVNQSQLLFTLAQLVMFQTQRIDELEGAITRSGFPVGTAKPED